MNADLRAGRQRGIATLLILLLLGLAMTVTVLGAVHALRGNQQRQLGTHADAAARAAAWRGVETLRQTLLQTDAARLLGWSGLATGAAWSQDCDGGGTALDLPLAGMAGLQIGDARLTGICRAATQGAYRITARVTGCAGNACATVPANRLATATVEVVYEVEPVSGSGTTGGGSDGTSTPAVITFNNDLNLSGDIKILKDEGARYQINVNGDLTTDYNRIIGVDTIRATGSIQISSGSTFGTLESNGDIKFDGSVSATQAVLARGDICLSGGANAANATVKANGSVVAGGSVALGDVQALGHSDRDAQTTAKCPSVAIDADGNPYAVDLQDNSGAKTVTADGSVRINSGSVATGNGLRATGRVLDTNCGGSESGVAGKSVSGPGNCTAGWSGVLVQPGLQVPISPVSPVTLNTSNFNAYTVENLAHYAFKIDAGGYKVVTVRAIAGIADGTYFIGDYANTAETGWSRGYKDFMCSELAADSTPAAPRCKAPVRDPPGAVCAGYSTYNNCIAYDASSRTWTLSGTSLVPGIAWFEGNLLLSNGTYFNTFVATGNLSTAGGTKVYGMNYAGYDGTRVTSGVQKTYAPTGICLNTYFPGRYPTDYCNAATGTYAPPAGSVIGNYALLAGSYDGANHYVGGNIVLGSSSEIFGSVLSGNLYSSGGSTTIHGTVTALSQGDASHAAGGSTTLDLRGLPEGYTPAVQPCELDGSCPAVPSTGSGIGVQVRWARYL